ncbi:MAG TPA: FAD-binding oxidoreductase [Chloroflexota bacterium]|nr:FAD-binding oxidoreductase [Chloroflexota bacterium]
MKTQEDPGICDVDAPEDVLGLDRRPRRLVPAGAEDLAVALREAQDAGLAVVPWGGGTEQRLGSPPTRCDLVVETTKLSGIVAYAPEDLTVSVRAGTTLEEVQAALAPHGQFLPFDLPHPRRATLGGVLAANSPPIRRYRYGASRDLVIGLEVALPSGEICKSGGRVVKNVAGYDLCKLWVGSLGTLGVIVSANLRVHPLCRVRTAVVGTFSDARTCIAVGLALAGQSHAWSALIAEGPVEPSLVVIVEGFTAAVRSAMSAAHATIAASQGRARSIDDPTEVDELLGRLTEWRILPQPSMALLRIGVAPGRLAGAVEALAAAGEDHGLTMAWQADTGVGTILARIGGDQPALRAAIGAARAALRPLSGHLVVADGPVSLRRSVDAWAGAPGGAGLARAIKAKMDPHATLNPGRFCYGL